MQRLLSCSIGAVLPDIAEKSFNFLLFPPVSGNGKFLFHDLIICAPLIVIGFLLWRSLVIPLIGW